MILKIGKQSFCSYKQYLPLALYACQPLSSANTDKSALPRSLECRSEGKLSGINNIHFGEKFESYVTLPIIPPKL